MAEIDLDLGTPQIFDSVVYTDSGSTGVLVSILVNEPNYGRSYAGFGHTVNGVAYIPVGPFTDDPEAQPVTPDSYGQWFYKAHSKRNHIWAEIIGGTPPYGGISFGLNLPNPNPPEPVQDPAPTDDVNPAVMAAGLSASWVGPIPYAGMLYVIQMDDSATVRIYQFNVDGTGWSVVGDPCPIIGNYNEGSATPWWDGDHTITLAAVDGGSGLPQLVDFDLSDSTWGTPYGTSGGPDLKSVYALYKRPDDSLLLIGEKDYGSEVLPACIYSSGSWGAVFDVAANAVALGYVQPSGLAYQNTNPPKSCIDESGNVYVFFQAKGRTAFPDSTGAGPDSTWYGRAFYQRIATDNSTPAGAGNFLDFPGQDSVVDAGGSFPNFKDGDLAWNTHKGSLTFGAATFRNNGGDCFGKPTFIGDKLIIPIRRKIPGSSGFYDVNTDEQLNTYCTLLVGDSLPTPTFTEVTQSVEPGVATTSLNKCDAVGRAFYDPGTSVLSVVYLYSTIITPDPASTNNTALQRAVRLCQCQDVTGDPESWVWKSTTIYDIDNPPSLPAPFGMDAISNVTFALYGSTVIVIADAMFIFGCGSLTGSGVHIFLGLGLGPLAAVRAMFEPEPVEITGSGIPLWPVSVSELQALDTNWEFAVESPGHPTYRFCQNYLGFEWIRLYPAPSTDDRAVCIAGFIKPTDISATHTTIPISPVLGDAVLLAMVSEARLKEGNAQMVDASDAIRQILQFYEKCALAYWGGGL